MQLQRKQQHSQVLRLLACLQLALLPDHPPEQAAKNRRVRHIRHVKAEPEKGEIWTATGHLNLDLWTNTVSVGNVAQTPSTRVFAFGFGLGVLYGLGSRLDLPRCVGIVRQSNTCKPATC